MPSRRGAGTYRCGLRARACCARGSASHAPLLCGAGAAPALARQRRRRRVARRPRPATPPRSRPPAPGPCCSTSAASRIPAARAWTATAPRPERPCGSAAATSARRRWSCSTASAGPQDDVTAPASSPSARRALTSVPAGARSGPVALIDLAGKRSRRWAGLMVEGLQPALGTCPPRRRAAAGRGRAVRSRASSSTAGPSGRCSPTAPSGRSRWTCRSTSCASPTTP